MRQDQCCLCDPLQIQHVESRTSSLRGRVFAVTVAPILCCLLLVAVRHSSSHVQPAPQHSFLERVQVLFVSHWREDCWQPCGEVGGDCPEFCGLGTACCRRDAKFDPPECHGVTNFWTNHHECVEPVQHTLVKHHGQYCLKNGRCGTSGDCRWCGVGNACCKAGFPFDPLECASITDFGAQQFHTCVAPVKHIPVKHQMQNCLSFCGGRSGHCDWCGFGNLCCHFGDRWDPPECQTVVDFPTKQFHTCVQPGVQNSQKPITAQLSSTTTASSTVQYPASSTSAQPLPIMPKPSTPQTLSFYMYRAQGDDNYAFENVNAANIGGVLRYLHDVVVFTCPRVHNITRIVRAKVTLHATQSVFERHHWNFGPYVAFNKGKCTVPNCPTIWAKYGYVVGCQKQGTSVAHYPHGTWYSIPGPCPSQNFSHKSLHCKRQEPGGHCAKPDGAYDCTVHVEYAGHINLDDLAGIRDYNSRCSQGFVEYDLQLDRGRGTSFWNGKRDPESCAKREELVATLFKIKYPSVPAMLPEPECDWWR